jgi:hypothetical protein
MNDDSEIASIPKFPLERLSKFHSPANTPISGSISLVENISALIFPESSRNRVDFRVQSRYLVKESTRFVLKFSHWTGQGVQGYPWIYAEYNGHRLPARVQGRPFWINDRRCFIVDLGEEIPSGKYFNLVTQSLYVDELNVFHPYIAHRVDGTLSKMGVVAAFSNPPSNAYYGYLPLGSKTPENMLKLNSCKRFGYTAFQYEQLNISKQGYYCIYW